MSTPYPSPVDQLLVLGEATFGFGWIDYPAMGLAAEHVPELIRMATDEALSGADQDAVELWGPVHAWRALGQLRAEAAVEPLFALFERFEAADEPDDYVRNDIPRVLGMIGPAAFEPLRGFLARVALDEEGWTAAAGSDGLTVLAQHHPEMRDAVVRALMRQLQWWARQDEGLNSLLIANLVELKAVEAAPMIESVFAAGAVDLLFGDWEDAQVGLGLIPERITPRPRHVLRSRFRSAPASGAPARGGGDAAKRRRKAQKAARQRSRKRRR